VSRNCLIITYYFPPLGGGGVQRITKLIKYLHPQKWNITVISAKKEIERHIPKDHSLLKDIPQNIKKIMIDVNYPSKLTRLADKLPNYLKRWLSSFLYIPDSRKSWPLKVKKILTSEFLKKIDIVLISTPPYSLAMLAVEIQDKFNIPVVLDMRDHWTTNPFKIHPTILHKLIDNRYEKFIIEKIQYGVSAYQSLIDFYETKYKKINRKNWLYIPNGYDEDDYQFQFQNKMDDHFNIAFSGTFYSHVNNPKYFFRVMKYIKKKYPEISGKVKFHYLGKSMININKLIVKYGLENDVIIHGYLEHIKSLKLLSSMDALLVILDDTKYSENNVGGKVYEYLRLKLPILAMVKENGDVAHIIRKTDSGEIVPVKDTQKAAKIIFNWIKYGVKYAYQNIEKYQRENLAKQYSDFLEYVITNNQY
jgi:glycosyltransferase involved in cell wall biosynthesis